MADSINISPTNPRPRPAVIAFTLVEMLVAVALSSLVLTGVLATSVQMARSSSRLVAYAEMDTQVRRAFEQLASDLKAASNITWNGASDITVTIPTGATTSVTYTYAWSSTSLDFYRVPGASSANQTGRIKLITGIPSKTDGSPGLAFSRLDKSGNATSSNMATKYVQISAKLCRSSNGIPTATSTVSSRFLLRNKPTS